MSAARRITRPSLKAVRLALAALVVVSTSAAQERTLEELKAEAQARADRGAYPLEGLSRRTSAKLWGV